MVHSCVPHQRGRKNSYDPYATALKLQDQTRSDYQYSKVYYRYWVDSIVPGINETWPDLVQIGVDPEFGFLFMVMRTEPFQLGTTPMGIRCRCGTHRWKRGPMRATLA